MTPALRIEGLEKRYQNGVHALRAVDLDIEPGAFVAILGPNGAGKSTLINIVAQVVCKTAGRVEILGLSIDDAPQDAKMRLGVTPQEVALDMFFSPREILRNHSGYFGLRDNRAWCETLLERLGLAGHADKNSRSLSGGMRRRLTIAKALVHRPPVLILDEPTAGVDVALRHALWAFVRELHQNGTTVILTTHYLEEAQSLAERVAIMQDGRIAALDRTDRLLARFGSRRFELHLGGSETPEPLEGLDDTVEMQSQGADGWRITGQFAPERAPRLYQWMARHGARTLHFALSDPSLEEVFLKLTAPVETVP
jgi:ABC-2 type transport system ATP-binding protein